ncbi:hypothetical protein V8F20_002920 [Naviculisporaceae sp. PSN 640]
MWNPVAAFSAATALTGVPIFGILAAWVLTLKLKRNISTVLSPALRFARLFLRIIPPIYAIGLILHTVTLGIYLSSEVGTGTPNVIRNSIYLVLTGDLLNTAAAIGITLTLYLETVACLYVALGKTLWWRLVRLDAPLGGGLLLIFAIARFGRSVSLVSGSASQTRYDSRTMFWLTMVIEFTLLILALGMCGVLAFVMARLSGSRSPASGTTLGRSALGKLPVLLLIAAALWAARCSYSIAIEIKARTESGWTSQQEVDAQLIILPILQHWIGATVLLLLAIVARNVVWADGSVQPGAAPGNGVMDQYSRNNGYYPQGPANGAGYNYQRQTQVANGYPPQYAPQPSEPVGYPTQK